MSTPLPASPANTIPSSQAQLTPVLARPWRDELLRLALGQGIVELAAADPTVVMLTADLSPFMGLARFRDAYPDRYFNVGVAEQNLLGISAGMAASGLMPFCSTFAIFASLRASEQLRTSICYPRLRVRICAGHSGLSVAENGVSHQALEDLAITRAMPNLTVFAPGDAVEARAAAHAAAAVDGPVYIRLVRPSFPVVFRDDYVFEVGRARHLRFGCDLTIVTTGTMVGAALEAADSLAARGIHADVLHYPTIKPFDIATLIASATRTDKVLTCEEHSIVGGLGGAVAEALSEHRPTRLVRVGTNDEFCESGSWKELEKRYGLDAAGVLAGAEKLLG